MGDYQTKYKWPTKKLKDGQVFEICDIPSYFITYSELKSRPRIDVLNEIQEYYTNGKKKPTWDEMIELQNYFDCFIKDVDTDFKLHNFIKYEWYYPLRNKFIFKYRKCYEKIKAKRR
jgi:hypothetical protein